MLKHFTRKFFRYAFLLALYTCLFSIIFSGLIYLLSQIPLDPNFFFRFPPTDKEYIFGPGTNTRQDWYTECISFRVLLREGQEPFKNLMLGQFERAPSGGSICDFSPYKKGTFSHIDDYGWYWFGHLYLSVFQMLWLQSGPALFIIINLLILLFAFYISSSVGWTLLVLQSWFFIFSDFYFFSRVMSHGGGILFSFITFVFLASSPKREIIYRASLASGIYFFIDYVLSTPLHIYATLLGLVYTLIKNKHQRISLGIVLREGLDGSIGWIIGFIASLLAKQLSIIIFIDSNSNSNHFQALLDKIFFRLGLQTQRNSEVGITGYTSWISPVFDNYPSFTWDLFSEVFYKHFFILYYIIFFIIIFYIYKFKKKFDRRAFYFFLPLLGQFAWYQIASNHTHIHAPVFSARYITLIPFSMLLVLLIGFYPKLFLGDSTNTNSKNS